MAASIPRGTRDYTPSEAILLKKLTTVIEETFKKFGFCPIETPALELLKTLDAKAYGTESQKELFVLEGKEEGLRYDFTVPLARFMAMNRDIPLPFKRYQIGKIWRMDEPQFMRSRELMQADVDVVGSTEAVSDVECIAAIASAIEAMGIKEYTVFINSRVILDAILKLFNVPQDRHMDVIRAVDKLQKIGSDEVLKQITKAGLDDQDAEKFLGFIEAKDENENMLGKLANTLPEAKVEVERLGSMINMLEAYKLSGTIAIDLSLARGLDYYTGAIWEFVVFRDEKRLPTVAAGGRYDKLMALYSKNSVPAVGTSIGVGRIFDILNTGPGILRTEAMVHIAYIKEENLAYALELANKMRSAGIYVDLELTKRALSKQLEYINSMKIPYAAIVGNQEREAKKLKLRNMITGEESVIGVEEAITKLTKGN